MGCLCIPNCICHFELAKLNWRVLGEVCSKMGQFPDLPWIDSTLGKEKLRRFMTTLFLPYSEGRVTGYLTGKYLNGKIKLFPGKGDKGFPVSLVEVIT